MQTCSKCHIQSPDSAAVCVNCQADLREWSTTAIALNRFKENPRVKYVRVVVSNDCCPACQELEGAYKMDEAPSLPAEGCSHPLGCRCFYQPFLTEIYP